MTYDVNYFIKKFEAIPENKWFAGKYFGEKNILFGLFSIPTNQRCAQGHCLALVKRNKKSSSVKSSSLLIVDDLRKLFSDHLGWDGKNYTVALVNNGDHPDYQQPTPKQRILAALYDIKKIQEPEENHADITKSLAVLPINETCDTILGKEKSLINS